MMKSKQVYKRLFVVFITLLLLVVTVMGGRVTLPAFADTSGYTGVLEDLQKDSEFDASAYPDDPRYYSISVIQIAESTDGELFVYTYQPRQKITYLVATDINMSLTDKMGGEINEDEELSPADRPKLYGLTLLNSNGVFCKYKVNDFTVSEDETRYYNITSIYREWIKGIDAETGNDNTKNGVAFPVGKLYTATTKDGVVSYSERHTETIEILNPFAGFQRYVDGCRWLTTACDSHYVAFSTDWKIDDLYEADLTYRSRSVKTGGYDSEGYPIVSVGEWQQQYAFLTDDQEFKKRTSWLWGTEIRYPRIQSVKEFVESEELNDKVKKELQGLEWVLRFAETDYKCVAEWTLSESRSWTQVSEVTILRLKFMTDGKVYNLGAVSDKVTESPIPTNPPDGSSEIPFWRYVWNCIVKLFQGTANFVETLVAVVAILVVLVLLPLGVFILSMIFPAFGGIVKAAFKGLWAMLVWLIEFLLWILCLPFKGIAALIRKIRGE